jgi:hypothetical protein
MNNEIEAQLLKILSHGLLRIRALGYEGNAKACAIEADHLHNLPSLITNFESERLSYYPAHRTTLFRGESGGLAGVRGELEAA